MEVSKPNNEFVMPAKISVNSAKIPVIPAKAGIYCNLHSEIEKSDSSDKAAVHGLILFVGKVPRLCENYLLKSQVVNAF